MSQENVETIKEAFAAHNHGDLDAMVELYDEECVFETRNSPWQRGHTAALEGNKKNLSGYNVVPVELIDVGEKVVAVAQMEGTGPVSQIPLDDRFAFVFTLMDGRIVREQAFRNRAEALEAVGLSEQDAHADS